MEARYPKNHNSLVYVTKAQKAVLERLLTDEIVRIESRDLTHAVDRETLRNEAVELELLESMRDKVRRLP